MFSNAHFRPHDGSTPPYIPEDFLGTGNYEERKAQWAAQKAKEAHELQRAQQLLAGPIDIQAVPEWAK